MLVHFFVQQLWFRLVNDFAAGKISQSDLTKVEDQAIRDLVEKEIAAGLKSVTDGEFRRALLAFGFLLGLWWH